MLQGKEALLNAIGSLSKSCHKAISSDDPAVPNAILSVVYSACAKKVKIYREAALFCLEQVITRFHFDSRSLLLHVYLLRS